MFRTRKGEFAGCLVGCGYFVRLHFSRVRPAPARNTWYQRGPFENENIASHIYDKHYLNHSIMLKIDLSIMNKRLHQTVACTIWIFLNDALVFLVISLKSINTNFVHSLLNSITTPCMVLLLLQEAPPVKQHPLTELWNIHVLWEYPSE